MCLTNCGGRPPEEDRVFWKVVSERTRQGPYFRKVYTPGQTVNACWFPKLARKWWGLDKERDTYDGGVIHVYTTEITALSAAHHMNNFTFRDPDEVYTSPLVPFTVIEVKCRPEHWIAWGYLDEAAYTQVEVLT